MIENKNRKNKRPNAWKRYGALMMAGALLMGVPAVSGRVLPTTYVNAEEETEKRVTLNIAGDDRDEAANAEASDAEQADTEAETEKRVTLNVAGDEKKDSVEKMETEEIPEDAEDAAEEITETQTEAVEEIVEEVETEAPEKKEYAPIADAEPSTEAMIVTTDVSAVVENCMPSIVSITSKSVEEIDMYYYGVQEYEVEGAASGIIIAQNEEELLIATNSHVVDGKSELNVCFTAKAENTDDLVAPAKVKGMDRNSELAVLAVRHSDIPQEVREQLRIAKLGSSDALKVGQAAIAIGNALGYGQSVTSGIISALNRPITLDNFSKEVIVTDAAINFGNSGGALLNAKGEVIGINVAKETGDASESMGYSIPIDTAIPILKDLVNRETRDRMDNAERGYMGATVVNVSDDAKELYNMPQGAFVYEVTPGSAADKAGIKKGDIITKFDGMTVLGSNDLIDKMGYYKVGETITLEIKTANGGDYESREVEVTLQKGAPTVDTSEPEAEEEYPELPEGFNGNFGDGLKDIFGGGMDGWEEIPEIPYDNGNKIF